MRTTWWGISAALLIGSALAQGTINFNTRLEASGVNAPVVLYSSPGEGPGPMYSAALFLVHPDGSLTRIPSSLTTFRDGSVVPSFARYVEPVVAEIPFAPQGSSVTVRMRAWLTRFGSYDTSLDRGESENLLIPSLGGGPTPPADLPASFTGFILGIPEPSAWALGIVGAGLLLIARRK